jgi:hypothetical protein
MSKINMSFDTEAKTCSIDIDGTAVDNVMGASVYAMDMNKFSCEIATWMKDDQTGITHYHRMMAGEKGTQAKQQGAVASKFPGFFVQTIQKIHHDIQNYFRRV